MYGYPSDALIDKATARFRICVLVIETLTRYGLSAGPWPHSVSSVPLAGTSNGPSALRRASNERVAAVHGEPAPVERRAVARRPMARDRLTLKLTKNSWRMSSASVTVEMMLANAGSGRTPLTSGLRFMPRGS